MKNFIWVIFFAVLGSCSPAEEESKGAVYKDVLPELVYKESFFNSINEPPPPPPFQKQNESDEVYALRVKVDRLEEEIKLLKEEASQVKKIYLLNKLLPIEPDSFKPAGVTTSSESYDSSWLGKPLPTEHKDSKRLSLEVEAGLFEVKLIEEIPEPYSTKEKKQVKAYYLQLSDIAFNDTKNKGIFYYAVASDGNKNGVAGYAYIVREKNDWTIKKVE